MNTRKTHPERKNSANSVKVIARLKGALARHRANYEKAPNGTLAMTIERTAARLASMGVH